MVNLVASHEGFKNGQKVKKAFAAFFIAAGKDLNEFPKFSSRFGVSRFW